MARTYVITGSAAGIGRATQAYLEAQGARVLGADIRDAEIIADLATAEGRETLVRKVAQATGGKLDAIIANAGSGQVELNFFGTVATLEGLRPLLAKSAAPRAVATSSSAILHPVDDAIVMACLAGDENAAITAAARMPSLAYASSKRALARWIRRASISADWAGAGIPLNAIAPGVTRTAMTAPYLATAEARANLDRLVPMPLAGYAEPPQIAPLLAFLTSPENTHITGQVIFIDGGSDAVLAGDDVWESASFEETALSS